MIGDPGNPHWPTPVNPVAYYGNPGSSDLETTILAGRMVHRVHSDYLETMVFTVVKSEVTFDCLGLFHNALHNYRTPTCGTSSQSSASFMACEAFSRAF